MNESEKIRSNEYSNSLKHSTKYLTSPKSFNSLFSQAQKKQKHIRRFCAFIEGASEGEGVRKT